MGDGENFYDVQRDSTDATLGMDIALRPCLGCSNAMYKTMLTNHLF